MSLEFYLCSECDFISMLPIIALFMTFTNVLFSLNCMGAMLPLVLELVLIHILRLVGIWELFILCISLSLWPIVFCQ